MEVPNRKRLSDRASRRGIHPNRPQTSRSVAIRSEIEDCAVSRPSRTGRKRSPLVTGIHREGSTGKLPVIGATKSCSVAAVDVGRSWNDTHFRFGDTRGSHRNWPGFSAITLVFRLAISNALMRQTADLHPSSTPRSSIANCHPARGN